MPLGTALAIGSGISAIASGVTGLVGSRVNYNYNKALQEDAQLFNSNEARLAYKRNAALQQQQFTNQQILDTQARDWQTRANQLGMDFEAQQAEAQREFQKYMASNAHQIEMADLSAAGLNPILAANLSGATVPNGAAGSGFAYGASGSSAGSASASSARSNANSVNARPFDGVTNLIGNFMSNALEMSRMHEKFQHELNKIDKWQHYYSKDKSSKIDDDFWDLAVARAQRDI